MPCPCPVVWNRDTRAHDVVVEQDVDLLNEVGIVHRAPNDNQIVGEAQLEMDVWLTPRLPPLTTLVVTPDDERTPTSLSDS